VQLSDELDTRAVGFVLDSGSLKYTAGSVTHQVTLNGAVNLVLLAAPATTFAQLPGDDNIVVNETPAGSVFINTDDGATSNGRFVIVAATASPLTLHAGPGDVVGIGTAVFGTNNGSDTSSVIADAPLTVQGGHLTVDDGGNLISGNFTITDQSYTQPFGFPISYSGLAALSVIAGNGQEDVTIQGSTATASFNGLVLNVKADINAGATAGTNFHFLFNEATDVNPTISVGSAETGASFDFNNRDRSSTISPRVPPAPLPDGKLTATFLDGKTITASYFGMSKVTAEPDADHSFVQSLFHDVLGTSGTQAQLNQYVALLPLLGQEGVAIAINQLPEAEKRVVDGFFAQYLHAKPTAKEENQYVQELANGETQVHVLSEILASPKFLAEVFLGSNESPQEAYIEALYKDLLGLPESKVTQREIKFWEKEIKRLGRAGVAEEFLESDAYRTIAVRQDFERLVHRAPTARELDQYVHSDLDLLGIQEAIEGKQEFFNVGR
jgi:hypothetical protein